MAADYSRNSVSRLRGMLATAETAYSLARAARSGRIETDREGKARQRRDAIRAELSRRGQEKEEGGEMSWSLIRVRPGFYRDDRRDIEIERRVSEGVTEWVATGKAVNGERTWLTTRPTLREAKKDVY